MPRLTTLLAASAAGLAISAAAAAADTPKKIGYVTNYATHEWYQNVIKGMQDRAAQLGIELEVRDANLDVARQIAAAEDFMASGVDVLILTPVNEEGVVQLLRRAKEEDLPVVLEGNPVAGMTTMVAICYWRSRFRPLLGGIDYVFH
jgi:ribose transport system substrate-binding protein